MKGFLVLMVLLLCPLLPGAEVEEHPEVVAFAKSISGVTWNLQGTFGLKHLRFDGQKVLEIKPGGIAGGVFESAFVDDGVFRLNFRGPNTGWYFFSPSLRFVTPLTVSGEVQFHIVDGATAKPVKKFPEDIVSVVYESEADERGLESRKIRWNGTQIELGRLKKDGSWEMERHTPVVAHRRVFECETPSGPFWFAFSIDGKQAWVLILENVFGGEAASNQPRQKIDALPGLTAQQMELLSHIKILRQAQENVLAANLERHLLRLHSKNPELLKKVKQQLAKW